jgi:hypothetical protein
VAKQTSNVTRKSVSLQNKTEPAVEISFFLLRMLVRENADPAKYQSNKNIFYTFGLAKFPIFGITLKIGNDV